MFQKVLLKSLVCFQKFILLQRTKCSRCRFSWNWISSWLFRIPCHGREHILVVATLVPFNQSGIFSIITGIFTASYCWKWSVRICATFNAVFVEFRIHKYTFSFISFRLLLILFIDKIYIFLVLLKLQRVIFKNDQLTHTELNFCLMTQSAHLNESSENLLDNLNSFIKICIR